MKLLKTTFILILFSIITGTISGKSLEWKDDLETIDSLTNSWYTKNILNPVDSAYDTGPITQKIFDEKEVIEKIGDIQSPFELTYNQYVKAYIQRFTQSDKWMGNILGRSRYFFPMIEEILDKNDIPLELKYLAIVESALQPTARSPVGASGLWQFMYATGKMYGLETNSFIDERQDPVKSTYAAASYMKDLYAIYGDWYLVIAAYNCGPGNVNKAMRRSGKRDYWDIYPYLPKETRGYVPIFIAITYTMTYYEDYNIPIILPKTPMLTDTVSISQRMNLKQIAEVLNIPMDELEYYNPQYRKNIIPATDNKIYSLRLATENIGAFIESEDSILNYKRTELVDRRSVVANAADYKDYEVRDLKGKTKLYYKVKSGDNIGLISDWFDVRASDLAYWNNVRKNRIKSGQKLVVFVPNSKRDHYSKFLDASFNEKQKLAGNRTTPSNSSKEDISADVKYTYHKVRSGENPWTIAQQYPGVSSDDIIKLNDISAKGLKPGQNLKIKLK